MALKMGMHERFASFSVPNTFRASLASDAGHGRFQLCKGWGLLPKERKKRWLDYRLPTGSLTCPLCRLASSIPIPRFCVWAHAAFVTGLSWSMTSLRLGVRVVPASISLFNSLACLLQYSRLGRGRKSLSTPSAQPFRARSSTASNTAGIAALGIDGHSDTCSAVARSPNWPE
jgi:hypothetical protein